MYSLLNSGEHLTTKSTVGVLLNINGLKMCSSASVKYCALVPSDIECRITPLSLYSLADFHLRYVCDSNSSRSTLDDYSF